MFSGAPASRAGQTADARRLLFSALSSSEESERDGDSDSDGGSEDDIDRSDSSACEGDQDDDEVDFLAEKTYEVLPAVDRRYG